MLLFQQALQDFMSAANSPFPWSHSENEPDGVMRVGDTVVCQEKPFGGGQEEDNLCFFFGSVLNGQRSKEELPVHGGKRS